MMRLGYDMGTTREQIRQNRREIDRIIEGLTPEHIIDAFIAEPGKAQDGITIAQLLLPGMLYGDCNETRRKKLKAKIYHYLAGIERRSLIARAPDGWWYYSPEFIETEEYGGKPHLVLWRQTEDDPLGPCLFCGRRHIHGEGDGHRGSHCNNGCASIPKGCFLRVARVGLLVLREEDGYIVKTRKPKK